MQLSDLPDVMVIEKRNYSHPWTKGIFQDCMKAGYTLLTLKLDDSLIGYGVMQIAADEAHVLNLCIDKAHNRKGFAKSLLGSLIAIAERAEARMVFLEVRPSNPRAMLMYERAGFNEIGRRTAYYDSDNGREDAIVMAKTLAFAD